MFIVIELCFSNMSWEGETEPSTNGKTRFFLTRIASLITERGEMPLALDPGAH